VTLALSDVFPAQKLLLWVGFLKTKLYSYLPHKKPPPFIMTMPHTRKLAHLSDEQVLPLLFEK
jgi:hypothetical protein